MSWSAVASYKNKTASPHEAAGVRDLAFTLALVPSVIKSCVNPSAAAQVEYIAIKRQLHEYCASDLSLRGIRRSAAHAVPPC